MVKKKLFIRKTNGFTIDVFTSVNVQEIVKIAENFWIYTKVLVKKKILKLVLSENVPTKFCWLLTEYDQRVKYCWKIYG